MQQRRPHPTNHGLPWQRQFALGALLLGPLLACAQAAPGRGLAGTAHDFTSRTNGSHATVGSCSYCHTPHNARQTRLLWNHALSANTFRWSDAATTSGGTRLPTLSAANAGPSVRCLSCHDGTVAIGAVSWYRASANATLDASKIGSGTLSAYPTIGTSDGDLKGNHPVAIAYPFARVASTYNGTTTAPGVLASGWQADPTQLNIRLYTDNSGAGADIVAGATTGKSGIECSSCHDPHNVAAVDKYFLRGALGGSDTRYICLKCHAKG